MRKEFTISFAAHLILIIALGLSSLVKTKMEPPRKIYTVKILSAPKPVEKTEKVEPIEEKKPVIKEEPKIKAEPKKQIKPKKKESEPKPEPQSQPGTGDSKISVDQPDFNDDFYLNLLIIKVTNNWQNPIRSGGLALKTVVYFRILKDGTIDNAKIEKRSGNSLFDQSALRAIMVSEPFPELPVEYKGDHLGVHFQFEHIP
ncbi:TonB family protein [bacterium]|nr:TonB family protein [bacterium]